ncbi:MAG TPA: TonB-dependent receptor plug domain-containing protein, partial [Longimicrobiales bacterium]|nr:TonB-dependent receptor plug domain-containing protein [Longimicrobiales bacterium]
METWRQVARAIGIALLFAWDGTNGVDAATLDVVDESIDFDIPQQPLRTAVEAFARQTGGDTYIGREVFDACGELAVGPLVGRMTLQDAWTRLAAPVCAATGVVVEGQGTVPVFMMDHPWVRARDIDIPRGRLHEVLLAVSDRFGALSLTLHFNRKDEAEILVGPIQGHMTPEEVLTLIEHQAGVELAPHPSGPFAFSLGPSDPETPSKFRISYARPCSCPPRVVEPLREKVLVVGRGVAAPADQRGQVRFSRGDIEATGAATLPEFFRYLARNAYSRHAGYIASGAQYADFRGLGRDTHLVTINGRRTLPSANNVTSSAFDLNTIPLSAVDHVDIHYDSGSLRYGSDAIAGTIDIVTRRHLDELAVEQRYGIAAGGAEQWRTTLSLGGRRGAARFAATLDHLELGDLLGHERAISRDQDYRPYGGLDYRASFGIRSLDGADLPGLNAPVAGLPEARDSDDVSISDLVPGEPQRISLSKYQSLVPAGRRTSFVGAADFQWRDIEVSADALLVSRDSQYDYHPAIASGIVGAEHPGSPFDEEVWTDAVMTGAPSMQQHVDS